LAVLGSISTVNVSMSTRITAARSAAFKALVTAPAQRSLVMSLTWNAIILAQQRLTKKVEEFRDTVNAWSFLHRLDLQHGVASSDPEAPTSF